jgi:hypothetical protein
MHSVTSTNNPTFTTHTIRHNPNPYKNISMNTLINHAIQSYNAWEPIAQEAFDLLLKHRGDNFFISASYPNDLNKPSHNSPKKNEPTFHPIDIGWRDIMFRPIDINANSAHTRLAFNTIRPAFEKGIQNWAGKPFYTLSRRYKIILNLYTRFTRINRHIQPLFRISVYSHTIEVRDTTLHGVLYALHEFEKDFLKSQR